ncbi:hypothetical protein EXS71_03100 [Candidatus Uhrbacteria bacterium]|nr:hypothetical protein [Candidatus Uhrbacteria bacterium]
MGKEEEGTRGVQRQVEKYILSGHQKDGTPMEYDVLARFNTTDAKIYWRPDLQKAWGLCHGEKEVSIKYIDDAHSLHTLLHELRHTFQRTEQIFGDLHWDYESVIEEDYTDDEKWTRKIQTEYGIKIIKKILSFIYQEDEVNRILQGLNTEKWKVDIENLELAERELGSFSKRKRELRDDYERKVSDLPRTVFRKHLHPLIPKENYAKMRSLFASAQNPLESLLQAKTFYANGEITHDTDQQIVADIFRSLKNGFSAEDAADQYGVWHLIFDWDKAIIDPVTNTLTLERKYRQIGIRFEMNPNNPIPLEDLKEKIESEFEVEKNKLQLEYASEQMKLENEKARAHEMVQQASAHLPNAQTLIFGSVRMVDVLRLPTFLIERDAEYGALIGLRAIKKECGINFLQSFHPNPEDVSDPKKTKKIDSIANIESYMERIGIAKEVIAQINAKRVMNANGKILLKR